MGRAFTFSDARSLILSRSYLKVLYFIVRLKEVDKLLFHQHLMGLDGETFHKTPFNFWILEEKSKRKEKHGRGNKS